MCKQDLSFETLSVQPPKKHVAPEDLWTVHGKRYDLSAFVARHPGGRIAIECGRGRDCTEMFETYHNLVSGDKISRVLDKYHHDDLGEDNYFDWKRTPFYDTLKQRVGAYFRDNNLDYHATPAALATYIGFALMSVVCWWYWLQGSMAATVLLPVCYWLGPSHMMHNGAHFCLSKVPWVNEWLSYTGCAHVSLVTWYHQHVIGHHSHTDIHGLDPDLQHFSHHGRPFFPGYRLSKDQPYNNKYMAWLIGLVSYSHLTTLALGLINEIECLQDDVACKTVKFWKRTQLQKAGVIFSRFCCSHIIWLPFFFYSWDRAIVQGLTPYIVHGLLFWGFSQVSHCHDECFEHDPKKVEWAEHQMRSCLDYGTASKFWNIASIGLNMQAIHHLFPQVDDCHYIALYPIVKQTAEEFKIPYVTESNWFGAFAHHLQHVMNINSDPSNLKGTAEKAAPTALNVAVDVLKAGAFAVPLTFGFFYAWYSTLAFGVV